MRATRSASLPSLLIVCLQLDFWKNGSGAFNHVGNYVATSSRRSTEITGLRQRGKCILNVLPRPGSREDEIRRKIIKLKKDGKLGNSGNTTNQQGKGDDTTDISSRGSRGTSTSIEVQALEKVARAREKSGKSSSVARQYQERLREKLSKQRTALDESRRMGLEDEDDNDFPEDEESDKETLDLIAQKWAEKSKTETSIEKEETTKISADDTTTTPETLSPSSLQDTKSPALSGSTAQKTTTGVGGSWQKNAKDEVETYKPSRGSWGAFPRPKDISKAYGGGRRVGAGFSSEEQYAQSVESTRDRLQRYREKVGIVVQSEIDNREEIEEALALSGRAMLRGVYGTAVSALEKITPYCSTNSPTGGKVFLELGMAYEAIGRTKEATTVYRRLTESRTEEIKFNAKRLLYGIEALSFMQNEMKDNRFSRKKASQEFIDVTGFNRIADNFDDRYATGYVDISKAGNFYKRLTESVVRSNREARLILLQAVCAGEVERLRIVQALRNYSNEFDTALRSERELKTESERRAVVLMDGTPISRGGDSMRKDDASLVADPSTIDNYRLASPEQTINNAMGEWRLQLTADKRGDGVRFYNETTAWQRLDTEQMDFECYIPSGFLTVKRKGSIEFDETTRTMRRGGSKSNASKSSGGLFSLVPPPSAAPTRFQVLAVDSELFVTRIAGEKEAKQDNVKDYFAVWRRVDIGTYSDEGDAKKSKIVRP